ncbi:MAG: sigma-70 family RNA polymerase sigma factor [Acidobacteria bacterium]|jgi:RNA polymerase sigma factor (sigma-70 family)|nr:MAG: sigma-70 family RNA polymerase sigma factor [Acidobacteriota bacterium]
MMPIRELPMTNPRPGDKLVTQPGSVSQRQSEPLLSDEPTIELVIKARGGDRTAVEALLQRCLPSLRRWTHGRLPAAARANLDTEDLVQETALHVIRRLDKFEPQHVGSMQAYLRQSVINRIRDEVRRIARHPAPVELLDDQASDQTSPLEAVLKTEAYERYRQALSRLDSRDREIIVARIEVQWSLPEIARQFQTKTVDAARMRVTRALRRLTDQLKPGH